jgi:hypothetical protein
MEAPKKPSDGLSNRSAAIQPAAHPGFFLLLFSFETRSFSPVAGQALVSWIANGILFEKQAFLASGWADPDFLHFQFHFFIKKAPCTAAGWPGRYILSLSFKVECCCFVFRVKVKVLSHTG